MTCRTMRAALLTVCLAYCGVAWGQQVSVDVFSLFHPRELIVSVPAGRAVVIHAGDSLTVLNGERGHAQARVRIDANRVVIALEGTQVRTESVSVGGDHASLKNLDEFVLAVPGKISRRYAGTLTVTARGDELVAVVTMAMETAVASVVAAEAVPGAGVEALKAQAVVARSYLAAGSRHADYEFCDTTHCQYLRQPPAKDSDAWRATSDTQGMILTYRGKPVAAMYSASCGGRTRTLREIGLEPKDGYPYYAASCAYCKRHPVQWQQKLTAKETASLAPTEQSRLALDRVKGWGAVPSNDYSVKMEGETGILHGKGVGHGVGMCQHGAAGMAAEGATFRMILAHYYPNTAVGSLPAGRH